MDIVSRKVGCWWSKNFNVINLDLGVGIGSVAYGKCYGVKPGCYVRCRWTCCGGSVSVAKVPGIGEGSAACTQVIELDNQRTAAICIDGTEISSYLCK